MVIDVAAGCYRPTCVLTGNVECFTDDCVKSQPNTTIGITELSSESVEDFIDGSATGNAAFQTTDVVQLCEDLGYDSSNIKPDAVIGFTTFYAGPGATGGEVGRFIDVCPIFYKNNALEDQYNCTIAWQNFEYDDRFPAQSGDLPLLPCCGAVDLLRVNVAGGQGTVTSTDPSGIIDCDEDDLNEVSDLCSQYDNNVLNDPNAYNGCPEPEITLTATADPGWNFSGWTGPCTGDDLTDTTCTVSAAQGYGSVTATFSPKLNVAIIGMGKVTSTDENEQPDGKIDCPENCDQTYPLNETVFLKASPDPGWEFVGWSVAGCSGSSCTFSMNKPRIVTATFVQLPIITVIIEGGDANDRVRIFLPTGLNYTDPANTDICRTDDSPCTIESLDFGAEVTFKKQGDNVTWSGLNCQGGDNSADTCTVILTEGENNTIYATFF